MATRFGTVKIFPTDEIENGVQANEYPIASGTRKLNLKECAGSSLGSRVQRPEVASLPKFGNRYRYLSQPELPQSATILQITKPIPATPQPRYLLQLGTTGFSSKVKSYGP